MVLNLTELSGPNGIVVSSASNPVVLLPASCTAEHRLGPKPYVRPIDFVAAVCSGYEGKARSLGMDNTPCDTLV